MELYQNYLLHISSVTVFELYNGAGSSEKVKDIELLLKNVKVLDFNSEIAELASKIYRQLISETHMIDHNHKQNKNIIYNHVRFHHTSEIKIIL